MLLDSPPACFTCRNGRLTVAVVCTRSRRASTARLERYSWEKRRITLKITIVRMIRADSPSPLTREMAARAVRSNTSGLLTLVSNCTGQLGVPCRGISLAPYRERRRSASSSLRPSPVLSSWASTRSGACWPIAPRWLSPGAPPPIDDVGRDRGLCLPTGLAEALWSQLHKL